MHSSSKVAKVTTAVRQLVSHPIHSLRHQLRLPEVMRASDFYKRWVNGEADRKQPRTVPGEPASDPSNPLRAYFESHREGRGIWKWRHYFEIYHRHLQKFISKNVHLVEIGVLSGGSLEMWKEYLGARSTVTGIDICQACRDLATPGTSIQIGDQGDRSFWKRFRDDSPPVDIVIDDGGHQPEQQIVTLEETLPFIRPGGVYVCEDVHTTSNPFSNYVHALADQLNAYDCESDPPPKETGEIRSVPTSFQRSVLSFHFYPYVIVVEKSLNPIGEFYCERRGTDWGGSSIYRRELSETELSA